MCVSERGGEGGGTIKLALTHTGNLVVAGEKKHIRSRDDHFLTIIFCNFLSNLHAALDLRLHLGLCS